MVEGRKYCHNGLCLTLFEWSKRVGIKECTLNYRLNVKNLEMEVALFENPARGVFLRRTRGDFDKMLDKRRTELFKEEQENDRKRQKINLIDQAREERQELNMDAVNEFFNKEVDFEPSEDFVDTDKRINALKRSFKMLYRKK